MIKFLRICKQWLILNYELYLDGRRLLSAIPWAGSSGSNRIHHLQSDIIRRYHVIEKGLAMPEFKPKFGIQVIRELIQNLNEWRESALESDPAANGQIAAAYSVLRSYHDRHKQLGINISELFEGVDLSYSIPEQSGGIRPFNVSCKDDGAAFERVVNSRASLRSFDTMQIPERELLLHAVHVALRAPSVCNRQTSRVHAYSGKKVESLLSLQNGNRGFGHRVPMLLITTSDLRYFTGVEERNQAWIDSGMFAMLLLLALQSSGMGAVSLNWSVLNKRDCQLRKTAKIPEYERIVMLIACGYPEQGAMVPISLRRPAKDTIKFH